MWAVKKIHNNAGVLINENYDSYLGGKTIKVAFDYDDYWDCHECGGGDIEPFLLVDGRKMELNEFLEYIAREANEMAALAANPVLF